MTSGDVGEGLTRHRVLAKGIVELTLRVILQTVVNDFQGAVDVLLT